MKNLVYPLLFIIILFACKDDDSVTIPPPCDDPTNIGCPNYDPCFESIPVSADFTFLSSFGLQGIDTFIREYDTVTMTRTIRFVASNKDYDSYEWQVGLEANRRIGDEIDIEFDGPYGWLDITLYVKNRIDSLCHPNDDGVDSLTQSIYVIHYYADSVLGMYGKYRGYNLEDVNDEYIIEITPTVVSGVTIEPPRIKGLKYACLNDLVTPGEFRRLQMNPHSFSIPQRNNNCNNEGWRGLGVLDEDGRELRINYSRYDTLQLPQTQEEELTGPRFYYTFIGKKIN